MIRAIYDNSVSGHDLMTFDDGDHVKSVSWIRKQFSEFIRTAGNGDEFWFLIDHPIPGCSISKTIIVLDGIDAFPLVDDILMRFCDDVERMNRYAEEQSEAFRKAGETLRNIPR